jgi:hypothetical protein
MFCRAGNGSLWVEHLPTLQKGPEFDFGTEKRKQKQQLSL